jgi:hypothetical protein
MTILRLGLSLEGDPLFRPLPEEDLKQSLASALAQRGEIVRGLAQTTSQAVSFKGEAQRKVLDPGDPRVAGWTYLANSDDPQRDTYADMLGPLTQHRHMPEPDAPLFYNGEPEEDWFDWLTDTYFALGLEGKQVPQYVLIVGGPDQVPFRLQSILDTVANVGRVDLPPDDLAQYVHKLIRLENAEEPVVEREAIVFATDGGLTDPTYFSREYMAQPIAQHLRDRYGLQTRSLFANDATKDNLLDALSTTYPALVYTASHGLGATNQPLEVQKRLNGAICCQHTGMLTLQDLFTAADVPLDQPFLEGAAFFQFACFGYGTPAQSDYAHWLDDAPETYAEADFVAALPKALLAHPHGPIAFVGHLDTAFLHAFTDQDDPWIMDRWHARIAPFVHAVNQLIEVQPSGLAMEALNQKYSVCNALLANTYDRQRRGKLKWTPELVRRFIDTWIIRSDAQNYMIYGDPAARLRIPAA